MYVDYTEDECKKELRSLELEAYCSVVSAFRAQGSLTKERKKLLQDLCSTLSISTERHRAEIRRAVNDEHLNTIAERLSGPNTCTEWAIEGRRLVPLMPRLVPQTVYTAIADTAAHAQAAKNATLPSPQETGQKEVNENDETVGSCKRKEHFPDSIPAQKFMAVESPWSTSFDVEPTLAPLPVSENLSIPEPVIKMDYSPTKLTSPVKPKHLMFKPSSTVTTFSTFDQLTSNLLASRPHEEQEAANDLPPSSPPVPVTTSSVVNLPVDPLPTSGASTTPSNKFLTHIRSKVAPRQSVSTGAKAPVSPKSCPLKAKQDPSFFPKKPPVADPPPEPAKTTQFSVAKPRWSESQTVTSTKITPMSKSFQKSQYVAKTLFSSGNKPGAKNMPPVIFNVSSTATTPLQSSVKTTAAAPAEVAKVTSTQLLPKSTTVGHSQIKISSSSAQTFQYRNEGRTRILNISPTVGSRLPISPSTISALGLATSTALRVTLPAGALSTSAAMRVSAAAKPNVIVVHKAQVWPRTQNAAVIMSSSAARIPSEVAEAVLNQKLEKTRFSGAKLLPRSLAPARPRSPAVSTSSVKITEVTATTNKTTKQPDSTTLKLPENVSEASCKENLLADAIEISGILESNSIVKSKCEELPVSRPLIDPESGKTRTKLVVTSTLEREPTFNLADLAIEKIKVKQPAVSPVVSEVEEKSVIALPEMGGPTTVQKNKPGNSSAAPNSRPNEKVVSEVNPAEEKN